MTARRCLLIPLALLTTVAGAQPPKPAPRPTLIDGAVARLGQTRLRHAEPPTCVTFAPDGRTFVTGAADGAVRVWSVATGELIRTAPRRGAGVAALQFTHGGATLAVYHTTDNAVRQLDPETLRETGTFPLVGGHRFAFSADGKLLATNDAVGNLVVTEADADLPKLELSDAEVFDFRPDGKAIATGGNGTVAIHLVTGGKRVFRLAGAGSVRGVAFSPDGARLAVGAQAPDGTDTVRIYTTDANKPVAEVRGMNVPLAWLTGDRLAVSNGADAGVYDLAKGAFAGRVAGAAGAVAVSPDGSKLVACGTGGLRVRLWDLPSGKQLHAEDDSFPDPALMIATRDRNALFLLAHDTAYLWPLGAAGARTVGKLPDRAVAAAAGGGTLVVATPGAVCAYTGFDPTKPLPAEPTITFDKSARATVVAVTAGGRRLAWADESGAVILTDLAGRARAALPVVTTSVLALEFSPDGTKLAQLGRDGFLRLWQVDGRAEELWKVRLGRGPRAAIAFSPDGKLLAAASIAQVPVLNVSDGTEAFRADRYSDEGHAHRAAFSLDGRLLVLGSGGPAGRVEVWELATRCPVRHFSTGHGGISRLCVFPGGDRIGSAGAEEAVTVWALAPEPRHPPRLAELVAAWAELGAPDAAVGYPAAKLLGAAGDRGTDVIAAGTKDLIAAQKRIDEHVADLGSASFALREAAAKELLALGVRSRSALGIAAEGSADPEVRDRARELLLKMDEAGATVPAHGLVGDALRLVRAVQALEQIGTPGARAVLRDIAARGGRAGGEASAALGRLMKNP